MARTRVFDEEYEVYMPEYDAPMREHMMLHGGRTLMPADFGNYWAGVSRVESRQRAEMRRQRKRFRYDNRYMPYHAHYWPETEEEAMEESGRIDWDSELHADAVANQFVGVPNPDPETDAEWAQAAEYIMARLAFLRGRGPDPGPDPYNEFNSDYMDLYQSIARQTGR